MKVKKTRFLSTWPDKLIHKLTELKMESRKYFTKEKPSLVTKEQDFIPLLIMDQYSGPPTLCHRTAVEASFTFVCSLKTKGSRLRQARVSITIGSNKVTLFVHLT